MMKRSMAMALVLASLLLPGAGRAGTAADPEITDPAGDVAWIPEGDLSFMDLRAAWFDGVRGDDGTLQAIRVTIRTEAPRPADQPFALMASWRVHDGTVPCTSEVHIADDATRLGVIEWVAQAHVYSYCEGDSNVVTIGPLRVVVLLDGREASFARDGVDYVVTVPLSSFDGSRVDGLYGEGTVLRDAMVNTFKVLPFAWIGVDYNQEARPYTL